jgi:hypothetical protein
MPAMTPPDIVKLEDEGDEEEEEEDEEDEEVEDGAEVVEEGEVGPRHVLLSVGPTISTGELPP